MYIYVQYKMMVGEDVSKLVNLGISMQNFDQLQHKQRFMKEKPLPNCKELSFLIDKLHY